MPGGAINVNTPVRADGSFEFASVAPGSYYLIATNNQGRNGAHAAKQQLDVGDTNIEGVSIAINPGADVTGHVRYDGDPPQPLPSLTVRLTPREMNVGVSTARGEGAGRRQLSFRRRQSRHLYRQHQYSAGTVPESGAVGEQ
jgi:hypothetical protein